VGVDAQGRIVATGPLTLALDADGQMLWSRQLSGTALAVMPGGGAVVAGEFLDALSLGSDDYVSATPAAFVAMLSSEGNVAWSYALSASAMASARAVAVGAHGYIVLAGAFRGTLAGLSWTADAPHTRGYLLHLDEAGHATELAPLPLADVADVALSSGGVVAVTGHTGDDGPRAQVVVRRLGARQLGVLDTGAGYGHAVSWQSSRTLVFAAEYYGSGGLYPVLEQLSP
jgi:hypothetical protein